jgi:hypothetical protein
VSSLNSPSGLCNQRKNKMKYKIGDRVSQVNAKDRVVIICDTYERGEIRRYRVQWEVRRTWILESRLVACPTEIVN